MTSAPASVVASSAVSRLRVDTLAASVTVLLGMTLLQRGIGFVRGILVCRWLEPAELGQWDLAYGFVMLAAPVAVFGLSGSYGRYLEHYRQKGQTRTFIRRTGKCIAALGLLAVVALTVFSSDFAGLIFGAAHDRKLVWLVAAALLATIAFNFVYELFGGLRLLRFAAAMHFWHSLAFAALGVLLALVWPSAEILVLAFGVACAACVAGSWPKLRDTWHSLPDEEPPLLQRDLWQKLLPFAASVWATNWLANLFDVTDRWMIVQCSGMAAAESLAAVGNYHAARLLPLPLLGVAALLRSAVLPHLSHDWELGRHDDVSDKLNLTLKLWGLTTLAVSATLMLAGPFVFEVAFQGKYAGGLDVLPLTMAYLSWAGIAAVTSSYLWCAERPGLASLPLLLGLIANVSLNLALVPMFGLFGAVVATAAANALALALMRWLSENLGLKRDSGVWVVCGALLLLTFGAAAAWIGLLMLLHQALQREWLLSYAERRQIGEVWSRWRNKTVES